MLVATVVSPVAVDAAEAVVAAEAVDVSEASTEEDVGALVGATVVGSVVVGVTS